MLLGIVISRHVLLVWCCSCAAGLLLVIAAIHILSKTLEAQQASFLSAANVEVARPEGGVVVLNQIPVTIQADIALDHLLNAALEKGVVLISTLSAPTSSTGAVALGGTTLSVTLVGQYPSIKETLAKTLERVRNATLQRLTVRRQAEFSDGVEANIVLTLWRIPVESSATTGVTD